jgi:hypothetical protein
MEREFIFKKVSKNDIFIDNIFYGREVHFTFPSDGGQLKVEIRRQDTQFAVEMKWTIGRSPCSLFLESLPPLATFSKTFEGVDPFSVPEEIRPLVFQAALEKLQKHFSTTLGVAISIDFIGTLTSHESQNGIDFVVTSGQNHVTAGTLVAPKEVLVLLAKKIQNTPNLHDFKELEASYRVCVGSTQLSKDDYRDLRKEDIVFLDQYELAKSKKVDIVGFDGVRILGTFAEMGVVVEQIS